MVGVIVMAGSWIYLGPRAVPASYFLVTAPPSSQGAAVEQWDYMGDTREAVLANLDGTPYTSITGPFSMFVRADPVSQGSDSILIGAVAALIAYLLFGLLGYSARFRRLEAPLGEAAAAFANRFGATKRARAWSLHLVVAGAIASGLVAWIGVLAVQAALTSVNWGDGPFNDPPGWAVAGAMVLLAVVSIGVVAGLAIVLRRVRMADGVGSFLVGYGGLLAALWVLGLVAVGASCVANPVISNTGEVLPAACVLDAAGRLFSDWSTTLAVSVLTLFCAIPAIGAGLIYRDYQRRRTAPSGPQLTRAAA
jgi:ABC-type multidrug transport system permease subunit